MKKILKGRDTMDDMDLNDKQMYKKTAEQRGKSGGKAFIGQIHVKTSVTRVRAYVTLGAHPI
jgi:hypothetical protein